jgi:hypothetical protein
MKVDFIIIRLCMHHVKNYTNKFPLLWRYGTYKDNCTQIHRTFGRASPSVSPRHEGSSSGSNDPIRSHIMKHFEGECGNGTMFTGGT